MHTMAADQEVTQPGDHVCGPSLGTSWMVQAFNSAGKVVPTCWTELATSLRCASALWRYQPHKYLSG